jgi:hypothetical protein
LSSPFENTILNRALSVWTKSASIPSFGRGTARIENQTIFFMAVKKMMISKLLQRPSASNSGLSSKNDRRVLYYVLQLFALMVTFSDDTRLSKQPPWIRKTLKSIFSGSFQSPHREKPCSNSLR